MGLVHVSCRNCYQRSYANFFMEQHGLKQEDLNDCAPQSRISDILNGKRPVSKGIAKKLARRFNLGADLLLCQGVGCCELTKRINFGRAISAFFPQLTIRAFS